MKRKLWTILKLALVIFPGIGAISYRVGSLYDASVLGPAVAICFGFLALLQFVVWLFYDVATLRRGGWCAPKFEQNPFAGQRGPGLHLVLPAVALMTFGFVKIVAASVHGTASAILGLWLLGAGVLLLAWQRMLRRLFKQRFADENGGQGAVANSASPHR